MQLNRIDDPRDIFEKMRRYPLVRFAHEHGQKDISETMPAQLIRNLLRSRGLSRKAGAWLEKNRMGLPRLGTINPSAQERMMPQQEHASNGIEVTADEDLMRQYLAQQEAKPTSVPTMTDLRKECKARGIKMARTDNMQTLREKLGKDPA